MNCPKTLELIKQSQELHAQALVQIQKFCDTFFDMRPKNDLNIFTELRKINTEYENLKKGINENLKQINHEMLRVVHIDTAVQPQLPPWGAEIVEHDTALGTIEWNKDKFKDALYVSPEQIEGEINGKELINKFKSEGIPVLNATVLDYLLLNPGQIPEEWKGDVNGKTRYIYFWGSIFRNKVDDSLVVQNMYWAIDRWYVDYDWLNYNLDESGSAAILIK